MEPVREKALNQWSRWIQPLRRSLRDNEPVLIALCAPLGAMVGFAVVMMHEMVSGLHWLIFGIPIDSSLSNAIGLPWLRIALVPAGGGLFLGLMADACPFSIPAVWRRRLCCRTASAPPWGSKRPLPRSVPA